jgi:nicotinamidase-related amidase
MVTLPANAALLLVDVQEGFSDPRWGEPSNPYVEQNIARLLAAWRETGRPIFHVHHDSLSPTGSFRAGTPGNRPKAAAQPLGGEPVYHKTVNSAFIGTTLEADLRREGIETLVIVGLTTQHCVSTTTRMAGNLGFDTYIVSDATAAYGQVGFDGRMRSAVEVHYGALSDVAGEFASVVETASLLGAASL